MGLQEDTSSQSLIKSYSDGECRVGNQTYTESIVLHNESVSPWAPHHFDQIDNDAIEQLLAHEPELVLLGTGKQHHIPNTQLLSIFNELGIALEHMNSKAACRTHLALTSEGRSCLTALIIE